VRIIKKVRFLIWKYVKRKIDVSKVLAKKKLNNFMIYLI
jgi:hypothetical protein